MKSEETAKISRNESGFSIDDTELSIFDAHMYFSGSNDPREVEKRRKKLDVCQDLVTHDDQRVGSPVSSVDGYGRNLPRASFNSTTTASRSEASWNSRTGLLMVNPAAGLSWKPSSSSNDRKKRIFAAKKWLLDRKSNCCIGKKAVLVKELESENTVLDSIKNCKNIDDEDDCLPTDFLKNHQQKKLLQENNLESTQETLKQRVSAKGRPFIDELRRLSFPVVSPSNRVNEKHTGALMKIGNMSNTSPLEDPPCNSLEAFRAFLDQKTVDPGSPILGGSVTNIDDDIGSDASSDLFEIDSLSAPIWCNSMYRRRDFLVEEHPTINATRFAISAHGVNVTRTVEFDMKSLDEPCAAASEGYPPPAPSEVSIDWSVATAEGLDKASVITNISSEICKAHFLGPKQEEVGGHGRWRKGHGLLLMGCREAKAVSVGPQPVNCVAARRPKSTGLPPRSSVKFSNNNAYYDS
ncbi:phytochrome kinase substrate-related family protein [Dorcoceras hygrometricum]|uniref:Phytochrome kinase substrate-related family protein n=1 Tax=Dorcoceras hygrometricum TaxID=472368 RepID=A0A2Z7BHV2_9LAMI|nr:phytochrome kinase substrate-related family protein [Dorcoceras hygrometricum]